MSDADASSGRHEPHAAPAVRARWRRHLQRPILVAIAVLLFVAAAYAAAEAFGMALPARLQCASFVVCIPFVPRRRVVRFAGWSCAVLASTPILLLHCLIAGHLVPDWGNLKMDEYMFRFAVTSLFVSAEAFVFGAGVAACFAGHRAWALLALGTTDVFVFWRWIAFPENWEPPRSIFEWPFVYFMP